MCEVGAVSLPELSGLEFQLRCRPRAYRPHQDCSSNRQGRAFPISGLHPLPGPGRDSFKPVLPLTPFTHSQSQVALLPKLGCCADPCLTIVSASLVHTLPLCAGPCKMWPHFNTHLLWLHCVARWHTKTLVRYQSTTPRDLVRRVWLPRATMERFR